MDAILFYRHSRLDHPHFVTIQEIIKGFTKKHDFATLEKPLKSLNQYLLDEHGLCHANDFYYIFEKLNDYNAITKEDKTDNGRKSI